MKLLLSLLMLLAIGTALANEESTCDVLGLSSVASSACAESCDSQEECLNSIALLESEAERCGCDSECQSVLEQSKLTSEKCEALEDEDDEDDEDLDDEEDVDELDKKKKKKKKEEQEEQKVQKEIEEMEKETQEMQKRNQILNW